MSRKSMSRSIASGVGVVVVLLSTAMVQPTAGTEGASQPCETPADGVTFDAAWEPMPWAEAADPSADVVEDAILDLDLANPAPDLDLQPASICRMAPQCATDADCDAICGVGQGRCGHSRCPVRVCKCG